MHLSFLNRPILAVLFSLALAAPALAEWRDIPYEDMVKMPLTLEKVDPQKVFTIVYRVKPGKGHTTVPADFRLQVKVGGQTVPIQIHPDGRVDVPVRKDWIANEAVVQTNLPKGRIKIDLDFNARTPPGTRMTYAQLAESVPVMERGIKDMAGMMSFMAPKVRELVLKFDKSQAQTATVLLPNGKKKLFKADAEGHAHMPWDPSWLKATVELSAPLAGIDQVVK